eukprot:TRINITY_DN23016_c0_g1_i1.p1 TRINITY_DN23016_c0_g1~~TRINITY_DN23016_c0_g1_i1.p1  ORF type:complete len:127 (+),score=15.05 TRINITY_DN23016_c0_g1_i1:119-499(+)
MVGDFDILLHLSIIIPNRNVGPASRERSWDDILQGNFGLCRYVLDISRTSTGFTELFPPRFDMENTNLSKLSVLGNVRQPRYFLSHKLMMRKIDISPQGISPTGAAVTSSRRFPPTKEHPSCSPRT